MRTHVIMFQARFVPRILDGTKFTTIRPVRKVPIKVGDCITLKQWVGKPRRSKQVVIGWAVVDSTSVVVIEHDGFRYGWALSIKAEGFDSWEQMRDWFAETHGLPFHGVMIRWKEFKPAIPMTDNSTTLDRPTEMRPRNLYTNLGPRLAI